MKRVVFSTTDSCHMPALGAAPAGHIQLGLLIGLAYCPQVFKHADVEPTFEHTPYNTQIMFV
jgi:hypothetical protein